MPCGGIYPMSGPHMGGPINVDGGFVGGRCWQCSGEGATHFCDEWDCSLHARCIATFLLTDEGLCVAAHGHQVFIDFSLEVQSHEKEGITEEGITKEDF